MFAKRHYELIALALSRCAAGATKADVAYTLAELLEANNPRFDRARFLRACGL